MSYGFSAINDSGQVIISSGNDGGNYGDFPSYSGSNDTLDGRVIFTYTFSSSATPLVFIKPSDYSRWHGMLTQSKSGSTWTYDVIVSGTSTSSAPVLYCFVNAANVPASSDTHGAVIYKADGTTKTFDSRLNPLAVSGGGSISPPTDATDGSGLPTTTSGHPWNYNSNDHDFRSTTRYNSSAISGTYSNLMFSAPSLAQAVYKRQAEGYKCSDKPWPESGCQEHWSTAMWWVMYRNTFRIRSGYFDAGWTSYVAGYAFSSTYESGGWFGGGGGGYSTGSMPYTAKTINLTSNAFMITDATRYG